MALIERNFDGQDFKRQYNGKNLDGLGFSSMYQRNFDKRFFYILPCMMQKIYDADYYSTRRMQRDDINEIHAEKIYVTNIQSK